ncbi:helix-turn-helix domain-containing protein [Fusibacter ferrireducens]|uniref:Helix-turn-helix domain-containing protein n=1 Tax=Fusibacter ferrireducens TaxID=2785058 RepID=A0ABR9ZRP2_9FIRM|nr:helix-turn-helix domain-containing protein [Fusibacter ferrireducens]MBF4693122.1 helix-turn-helix domain-containing protein [Fusibacter ferrireducens]
MRYSKSTIAIPPGATIREQIENRGIKQKEFALRMGLSEKHVSRLINGQVELTQDVALRLESVLGVPATFWSNLEVMYREKLARVIAEEEMEKDIEVARLFPYAKIATLGWVEKTRNAEKKVLELRRFFEVAKLELLDNLRILGIAYRKTGESGISDYSLAVWAQKARLEARKYNVLPINISKLKSEIPKIREMTTKKPEVFCKELVDTLAECGIALIFLPHIGGSFLHGATFYDGKKIVMGLTVRGKYADKFWFSLFHELHHIISGHISNVEETTPIEENDSDIFAQDTLISPTDFDDFVKTGNFSKESIFSFANKISISPGIVLGRLQKENYIPYDRFNDVKEKYEIEY